ncbi:MAG: L-glutamate gamma-semialdehyde dehydrogenase [Xanthomonadaceae bacterium]|nr:L-glutamate gamma-semialdehyde dehydrogenase [Xanthomonadaceae bacterium]
MSVTIPQPKNEPIYSYDKNDPFKAKLKDELSIQSKNIIEIPCIIGGKEVFTSTKKLVRMPHSHGVILAEFHWAGEKELLQAAEAALKAKRSWENISWNKRAEIFLKAADLLAGKYRMKINAATMLGQSKNAYQAEIDAACELIDFLRFNAHYYSKILTEQPLSVEGVNNQLDYRPLEGFVLAITPFNFTAIAGNLPAAPAMLGNTVVWKPSDTQALSAYYTMKLFEEAGLPPGVINFVPADGPLAGKILLNHKDLAGVHFTGSSQTFLSINKSIAQNLENYKSFPRVVGETGGKDFVFAHPSADIKILSTALIRGAFEYQGQKCSAASRAYIPRSLWSKLKPELETMHSQIKLGDVRDFTNLMGAVIDERSFDKNKKYLDYVKSSKDAEIFLGGGANKEKGYFVDPTIVLTQDPKFKTMQEEIFGPILTLWVYEDSKLNEAIKICDETSPYALTGAIISSDEEAITELSCELRQTAGNLYINDKPTGAVVGQQPFGGARMSGTNDKAGSYLNLLRWLSPRTIKTNLNPPKDFKYLYMLDP